MARISEWWITDWLRRRPRLSIVALCGVLMILLGTLVVWWGKGVRAEQLSRQAQELASAGEWASAWEKVRAARQLDGENIGILRAAARIAEQVQLTEAETLWREARRLSGGSAVGLRGQVRVALSMGKWEEAEYLLADLHGLEGESREYLVYRARWHAGRGEMVAAVDIANRLVAADDVAPETHWLFVQTALNSPRAVDRKRARQHLRDLALSHRDPAFAREALRRFSDLPELSEGERDFAIRLWAELGRTRADRLQSLALQLAQFGARPADLAKQASALFDLDEPSERLVLGRWLNQHELYNAALEAVPEAAAFARHDLLLVRLDALALLDRWEAVQNLLAESNIPLQAYLEELFRMRSHYELGQMRHARIAWRRSLQAARREPAQLQFLARYTQNLGLVEFTEQALWEIVGQPAQKRSGYKSLLALGEQRKDAEGVLRVLEAMRMDFPHDSAVANDWAYYSLLLGRNIGQARAVTEELIELNPELLAHRMTLVLAHLRGDAPRQALDLIQSLPVADWMQVGSMRWRALVAVALARNGRLKEAEQALRGVDRDRLMPQEVAMVEAAMD